MHAKTKLIILGLLAIVLLLLCALQWVTFQQKITQLRHLEQEVKQLEQEKLLLQKKHQELASNRPKAISNTRYAKEIRHRPGAINFYDEPLSSEIRNAPTK